MTKNLIERVLRELTVDTKNYRYTVAEARDENQQWQVIKRLPIGDLDTTTALDGWEIVWSGRDG